MCKNLDVMCSTDSDARRAGSSPPAVLPQPPGEKDEAKGTALQCVNGPHYSVLTVPVAPKPFQHHSTFCTEIAVVLAFLPSNCRHTHTNNCSVATSRSGLTAHRGSVFSALLPVYACLVLPRAYGDVQYSVYAYSVCMHTDAEYGVHTDAEYGVHTDAEYGVYVWRRRRIQRQGRVESTRHDHSAGARSNALNRGPRTLCTDEER
eukprot:239490-Rhodomonas_salina.1